MGIDQETYPVVAILPLVQVAWADGTVQANERELIIHLASRSLEINATGMTLLENWLKYRPSDAYLQAGMEVLSALSKKTGWEYVSLNTLNDVIGFSWDVAKAAGGLFGFGRVEHTEKEALLHIATHLNVGTHSNIEGILKPSNGLKEFTASRDSLTPVTKAQGDVGESTRDVSFNFSMPKWAQTYAHLVFYGQEECISFPLGDQPIYIGRSKECDIQLRYDNQASNLHCSLARVDKQWILTDQESINGTFANSQQVSRRVLLGGERIQVGETTFTFMLGSA